MLSEVDVWKRLKHPNILQFFGANPFPNQPFLVSALMEYGDATEYLRRNPNADRTQIVRSRVINFVRFFSLCPLDYLSYSIPQRG